MCEHKQPDVISKNIPDYTLRKKYTNRPSHVIKLRLEIPSKTLILPTEDSKRLWTAVDDENILIKTWQFYPLPNIPIFFKNVRLDNVSIEFNIGPHPDDASMLESICMLFSNSFSLEFREQWAGPYPKNEDQEEEEPMESSPLMCYAYCDIFLEPFLKNQSVAQKVNILTGRLSADMIRQLPEFGGLTFLGLRVNYEEYLVLTEITPLLQNLERIHILPQWKTPPGLNIPPLRFHGVINIYYWELETTQEVKRSIAKWKESQREQRHGSKSRSKFLCCFK